MRDGFLRQLVTAFTALLLILGGVACDERYCLLTWSLIELNFVVICGIWKGMWYVGCAIEVGFEKWNCWWT